MINPLSADRIARDQELWYNKTIAGAAWEKAETLPDEVASFADEAGLAKQKIPQRIEVVSDLPRTSSGKIRKDVLRRRITELLARQECVGLGKILLRRRKLRAVRGDGDLAEVIYTDDLLPAPGERVPLQSVQFDPLII